MCLVTVNSHHCGADFIRTVAELNTVLGTGQKPFDLLKSELPYLIKTNLDILTGYFEDVISRKVSTESMISYEGKKYSVPPKYIGKKVDITDTGSGFDVSFNGHLIRHWEKSGKIMNFNHTDYLEIAHNSSFSSLFNDRLISRSKFSRSLPVIPATIDIIALFLWYWSNTNCVSPKFSSPLCIHAPPSP